MDPVTTSIVVQLAPYALGAIGMGIHGLFSWLTHKSHSATVQALAAAGAQTAQVTATAAANAAIGALQAGTTGKALGTAVATAARGAALATGVQGAQQVLQAYAQPAGPAGLPADDHG